MTRTLPWSWYSDGELLTRERTRIFERAWHYVGHLGQVARPGDHFPAAAGHVPVAVARDEEGELRAFLNVCRHRGAEVVKEDGNRRTLQCPYHAWTYGLDGSLRTVPRGEVDPEGISLAPVRLETWGPLIFVNPDPDVRPLAELLGGVPASLGDLDELVFFRRLDYELEANWKIVIENYLECYHCAVAHPGFSRAVDVDPDRYVLETAEWSSSQFCRARESGEPPGSPDPSPGPLRGRALRAGQFHFVWPNLRINVFPGPPNLSVGVALPVGPEKTAGFFDYFFPEGISSEEAEELIAFDNQVALEDRALVESVQRGVRTGLLEHGQLMPVSERLIAHFQRLVYDALED